GTITNTATETQTTADPSGTQSASASLTPSSAANVSITKTVADATPTDGTNDAFTLKLSNGGPDPADGVVVTDVLPGGLSYQSSSAATGTIVESSGTVTWTVGSLADGASATATI